MTCKKILKYTALFLTIICFVLICIFSFKSSNGSSFFNLNDKVMHCFAYFCFSFCLTFYAQFLTEHKKTLLVTCIALSLAIGLGIEILQPFFNRSGEMLDFIADVLGTVVGCVASVRFFPICKF